MGTMFQALEVTAQDFGGPLLQGCNAHLHLTWPDVMRAGTLSKILGAGVRLGWLCAPRQMIPAFQGFLFGGGVNPYVSRVATHYMRENLVPHVARLVSRAWWTSTG